MIKEKQLLLQQNTEKKTNVLFLILLPKRTDFSTIQFVRADGFNVQERAKLKAERYSAYSGNATKKSDEFHNKAHKDDNFPSLGEPIKVGHHSESRHRKIIEQSYSNVDKCVEYDEKSKEYDNKSSYWE